MVKTINDVIKDFDNKLNNAVTETEEEDITKSTETEEGAEETTALDEEVAEVVGTEEDTTEDTVTDTEEATEEEVTEEPESVEKSSKEDEEDKEEEEEEEEKDKEKKKDKEDKEEDEEDEEVKKSEDVEEPTEEVESLIKSADLLGAIEMVFKNLHDVIKTNAELNDKLDKLSQEFQEAKAVKEEVAKSANVDTELKKGVEDIEGKAVGYLNKSIDVEEPVEATEATEDTTEVVVDGETVVEPEKTFYEQIQEIRTDFIETYKRVSQSGVASRGEIEEARHLWTGLVDDGSEKTSKDLEKVKSFINKFK